MNIILATIELFHYSKAFKEMKHKQIQVLKFSFKAIYVLSNQFLIRSKCCKYLNKKVAIPAGGMCYIVLVQYLIECTILVPCK